MAKVYFICGFIGSGKTTYAEQLCQEKPAFLFSTDQWMIPLYGEHMEREVFDQRLKIVEGLFKQSAEKLIALGTSVVFDAGFWTAEDRAANKAWAEAAGLECEFHYLDVPYEECCRRAAKRNAGRGDQAYEMTPEMLELFWGWFEPPKPEELEWIERIKS